MSSGGMNHREIRDFVRATLGIQKSDPAFMSLDQARAEAARVLGVTPPSDAEFRLGLAAPGPVRGRGRPPSMTLTKRDAVAALATYFESVGAGTEQAIALARRWLGVCGCISRSDCMPGPEDRRTGHKKRRNHHEGARVDSPEDGCNGEGLPHRG